MKEKDKKIQVLDCTLRDGSYITLSHFGDPVIKGLIKKLQEAHIDIIECGWLKDAAHEAGSAYFHVPQDLEPYLTNRLQRSMYVVMIDWDRYNVDNLPLCDNASIDAVRVVFPHGKHKEGMEVARAIKLKGYKVLLQAANTLAYSNEELKDLALCVNELQPNCISIVDTFGAMFFDDLERIVSVLDKWTDRDIQLGFHSHNNQQLSFALSMRFIDLLKGGERCIVVDSSLYGMGRGAGNTTTELLATYLNKKEHGDYDLDAIMDAIDTYIEGLRQKYVWGYSAPYFVAGMYQCHVNNIAYLQKNHRTNARDMRNIISSLTCQERRKYDYDLLEKRYMENQDRIINDESAVESLSNALSERTVLLLAPGKSIDLKHKEIEEAAKENNAVVVGVNAINTSYRYDYLFFSNDIRYEYALDAYNKQFTSTKKILLSNIKTAAGENEVIVNFNRAIKRGYEHFDNAVICALRLMDKLNVKHILLAGFDGFAHEYGKSYCDVSLPTLNPNGKWDELNEEITGMFREFRLSVKDTMDISFVTESIFDKA